VTWLRRLGWILLAGATVAAALAAYLVDLPEPRNAIAIDRAVYQWGDGQSRDVALPLNASERAFIRQAGQGRYLARFDLRRCRTSRSSCSCQPPARATR
jgi:hypothetical protein